MFNWRKYANTPQEFLAKLDQAKMTMATPEEQKRGIVARFELKPLKEVKHGTPKNS